MADVGLHRRNAYRLRRQERDRRARSSSAVSADGAPVDATSRRTTRPFFSASIRRRETPQHSFTRGRRERATVIDQRDRLPAHARSRDPRQQQGSSTAGRRASPAAGARVRRFLPWRRLRSRCPSTPSHRLGAGTPVRTSATHRRLIDDFVIGFDGGLLAEPGNRRRGGREGRDAPRAGRRRPRRARPGRDVGASDHHRPRVEATTGSDIVDAPPDLGSGAELWSARPGTVRVGVLDRRASRRILEERRSRDGDAARRAPPDSAAPSPSSATTRRLRSPSAAMTPRPATGSLHWRTSSPGRRPAPDAAPKPEGTCPGDSSTAQS